MAHTLKFLTFTQLDKNKAKLDAEINDLFRNSTCTNVVGTTTTWDGTNGALRHTVYMTYMEK